LTGASGVSGFESQNLKEITVREARGEWHTVFKEPGGKNPSRILLRFSKKAISRGVKRKQKPGLERRVTGDEETLMAMEKWGMGQRKEKRTS